MALLLIGATVMGTGPGTYLVKESGPILGMPALYAWAVFWFFIQAATVITAYCTIWKNK